MLFLPIRSLGKNTVPGVNVRFLHENEPFKGSYFNWWPDDEGLRFEGGDIRVGHLIAESCEPKITQIEYHGDAETFVYLDGEALVLFCDLKNGNVDLASFSLARILPFTQVCIEKNKGHSVPISLSRNIVNALVISANPQTWWVDLLEEVCASA